MQYELQWFEVTLIFALSGNMIFRNRHQFSNGWPVRITEAGDDYDEDIGTSDDELWQHPHSKLRPRWIDEYNGPLDDELWQKPHSNLRPEAFKEKDFVSRCRGIHKAICANDFVRLKELVEEKKEKGWQTANLSAEPLLSVVIGYGKIELAMKLLEEIPKNDLMSSNVDGETALHVAAANGEVKVVDALVNKCKELMTKTNDKQETPLHKAALNGKEDVFWKLVEIDKGELLKKRTEDGSTVLHYAIMGNNPGLATEIAQQYPYLINTRNFAAATPLQLVVTIPEAFKSRLHLGHLGSFIYDIIPLDKKSTHKRERDEESKKPSKQLHDEEKPRMTIIRDKFPPTYSTLFDLFEWTLVPAGRWIQHIVLNVLKNFSPTIQSLHLKKENHRQTRELVDLLAGNRDYWDFFIRGGDRRPYESRTNTNTRYIRWDISPLIIGAEMGLDEFVKQILTKHPESAYSLHIDGTNVLQVAIKHGHGKIVRDIASMINGKNPVLPSWLLSSIHRPTGNTILHFAAVKDQKDVDLAFRIQHDFRLFKQIRELMPKVLEYTRNLDEKTAHELFTEKHVETVEEGKKYLTELGKTCSGLVAAVVFASSFSIPGDKDANQNPVFYERTAFKVFSHAYVIGLSSASASLVLFLSFVISSYKEQDFRLFLPIKYRLTTASFLLALVALLVAFSCNIYLQIYGGKKAHTEDIISLVCELTAFPAVCLLVLLYCNADLWFGSFLGLVRRNKVDEKHV